MDVETDLINQAGFEEATRQLTSAHHANVLPIFPFQSRHEFCGILRNDLERAVLPWLERAGKNVRLETAVKILPSLFHLQGSFVGLTPHHDGIDGLPISVHDAGRFVRPHQPIDRVILSREVAIQARGAAERYFPHNVPGTSKHTIWSASR